MRSATMVQKWRGARAPAIFVLFGSLAGCNDDQNSNQTLHEHNASTPDVITSVEDIKDSVEASRAKNPALAFCLEQGGQLLPVVSGAVVSYYLCMNPGSGETCPADDLFRNTCQLTFSSNSNPE